MEFIDLNWYNNGADICVEGIAMIRNSIRNKLIVFLLAATILPISTSIVMTYYFTKQNITRETLQTNSNLIYQGKTNIINYLNGINQASLSVYNDIDFYEAIEAGAADYTSRNEIVRGLQSIANAVKDIQQVYLYIADTDKSYLWTQGNIYRNETSGKKFIPPVSRTGDVTLEPTHPSHLYGTSGFGPVPPAPAISLHRKVVNAVTMKNFGVLSIDFNLNMLSSICEQLYKKGEEQLYILDKQGRVVYGPGPVGMQIDEPWVTHLLSLSEPSGSFETDSSEFKGIQMYERMATPYMEWTLVKRIPYDRLYSNARQLTEINTLILIGFLVVVISATLYISFRFTAPIKKLIGYIGKIQSGNMQVDIHVKGNDEFGILANRFRIMMQTINNLITQEYKLELANKTNQLKALQAQINPHFLYNSLQSIGTLALQHDAPRIYSLLSSLAKMMRYSMNTSVAIVPFDSEIKHVRSYMELQMQRFEHQLTVEYDIDADTLQVPVPKMILQPIVENYFKHGFDPGQNTGKLLIASSVAEDGRMEVTVADNGKGIPEEDLQRLKARLGSPSEHLQEEDSIGLINVVSRLRLYYNHEADMRIEHHKPYGVKVTILMPLHMKENGEL
ncbi:cache domain-containing sensor histidine kinase [Paenibacillus elgii]|uniref:cache domain-containing sensor histidine kinase n=1 Tax=Paenibacillus elgii TaxID=189691 RepID=UPI0013D6D400|nr:sensor histidine kinase [Paenibacillus elgii]